MAIVMEREPASQLVCSVIDENHVLSIAPGRTTRDKVFMMRPASSSPGSGSRGSLDQPGFQGVLAFRTKANTSPNGREA